MSTLVIADVTISFENGVISWTSGTAVDFDGAPNCYSPPDSGLPELDSYQNAYENGKDSSDGYCGVVTLNGEPVVQIEIDPCPGYWVSMTALQNPHFAVIDPRRYVDSTVIPYISIPPQLREEWKLEMGDVAYVTNLKLNLSCPAVVADIGPHDAIGESSPALCKAIGLDAGRHGGASNSIAFRAWPGSSKGWPREWSDVIQQVAELVG